ncbi:alpha/beta hydrolase [Ottowia sp.]|uniref:alpha/beta hydrolase n=1 Tax=Ottowia sp. TaxID=1898956 RepID=UPI003A8808B3
MARPNDSSRRDQPDTQWLERMYHNRMRVPDFGDYLARWAAESALARRSGPCELNVAYGPASDEVLDVFPAPASAPRTGAPVVVFIHGGYWKSLDKSQHSFVAAALRDQGAAVVVPNYTLCPRASIADITVQMVQAVAWAWRHAHRFNGDPRRLVVVGHSAGAQLAAMMLVCTWPAVDAALPRDVVKAALGISGIYELEPLMHTPSLQEVLRLTPAQVSQASPARLPAPARGRFWGVVGGDESGEFLRQTRLLQIAWGRERVPLATALPGLHHFSVLDALVQPGTRLHRLASQLLR